MKYDDNTRGQKSRVFSTPKLPAPKGPYSQAAQAGDFLFISGMIGINPETGEASKDFCDQTQQVLDNLRVLAEQAGGSLADIVKTTVFLSDMNDFAAMNEIYSRYFPTNPPARSTVAATPPGGFLIEIEAIAFLPEG
ncbi:MAG: hypothetical protein GTO55_06850 [Armatimonadetes bacterium]|nr:hypothetical protein [Armatimonadota bacterium]NIM23996.1 hypothetical protein [Armatimonadota bacterium]NIM67846.1 hypothetical protein [Armatimonadota bacterium]NIM76377.1 hypothetical protein [Armatimonadota bacterium]NIN06076.1 hypothetical protein [Armatimonadota bacterium]